MQLDDTNSDGSGFVKLWHSLKNQIIERKQMNKHYKSFRHDLTEKQIISLNLLNDRHFRAYIAIVEMYYLHKSKKKFYTKEINDLAFVLGYSPKEILFILNDFFNYDANKDYYFAPEIDKLFIKNKSSNSSLLVEF